MSAYICTYAHINAIVRWASNHKITARYGNPTDEWIVYAHEGETAQMLYAKNVASVNYRYKEDEPVGKIVYKPTGFYRPIEIIKLCNSLDYQSCEHPDWETSLAKALLDAIRQTAITKLPGYDEAPWSI